MNSAFLALELLRLRNFDLQADPRLKKSKGDGVAMAFFGFLASANVLKDAVQDLVAQVGHADVDVITFCHWVDGPGAQPEERPEVPGSWLLCPCRS